MHSRIVYKLPKQSLMFLFFYDSIDTEIARFLCLEIVRESSQPTTGRNHEENYLQNEA